MREPISVTCPACGKLNQRRQEYCISCGHRLPAPAGLEAAGLARQRRRKHQKALAVVGAFLLLILVAVMVTQNQPLLRSSTLSAAPAHITFYDRQGHQVMEKYLWGGSRIARRGYASGWVRVGNGLTDRKRASWVHYVDSRARQVWVVDSQPKLTFYYARPRGKYNDWGRCWVAGHPEIVTFRMTKLDGAAS